MDRRAFAIGIGVGHYMQEQNISASDVTKFFQKHWNKGECNEHCPFAEACDEVMELTKDDMFLCTLLGVDTTQEEDEES